MKRPTLLVFLFMVLISTYAMNAERSNDQFGISVGSLPSEIIKLKKSEEVCFSKKDRQSIVKVFKKLGYTINRGVGENDQIIFQCSGNKKNKIQWLFNGQNLDGWKIYLQPGQSDGDTESDFAVKNGKIHVIGKSAGYMITEKSYGNYILKVDFKWGEKKWPPRLDSPRDAGICYHIPMNEPDKIFPASIECQIQEGDTGDFWLIGNSTIEVDGKANEPADYTRIIKKTDAENPKGDWNTVMVISYNGTCIHIVNGVVVNFGKNASMKNGRILLQSEYAEVFYKNITIQEL